MKEFNSVPARARFVSVFSLFKSLALVALSGQMICGTAHATQIVYESESSEGSALYLHDTVTSSRVPLVGPLEAGKSIDYFQVSPKNKGVAYLADADTAEIAELYHVDLKKGLNERINPALSSDRDVEDFAFDGTGKNLFYTADIDTNDVFELYRTDIKKKNTTKMNPALQSFASIKDFEPLPNGKGAVIRGDLLIDDKIDIVLVTGSSAEQVGLSNGANADGDVYQFKVTPKGTGVVFTGDLDTAGVSELFYTDLKKKTTKKLSAALPEHAEVSNFIVDPKGKSVIYTADQEVEGKVELFKVDIKTGTVTKISGTMDDDRDVQTYGYSVDSKGAYALFLSNKDNASVNEVYRTSLKTGEVEKMSEPVQAGNNYGAAFDGKGNVYYIGDQNGPGAIDLFKKEVKKNSVTRIDDPTVENAHTYAAGIELKGAGVLYFTFNLSTFSFDYIYFDAKTGTRTSIQQPGESIGQFEVINSSEIFLAA